MSMNNRMQGASSGSDSGGGAESADLTGKDVVIMLGTAAVVVLIFGTLAMDGTDLGGDSDDDAARFIQTDSGQERLDIDAEEGYVSPNEAGGPRTGEMSPEHDPNQLSAREVNEKQLQQGDFSQLDGPAWHDAPEVSDDDIELVREMGADFDRPTSASEGFEMGQEPPSMDEIQDSMPSEVSNHVDIDEAQQRHERQRRGQGF